MSFEFNNFREQVPLDFYLWDADEQPVLSSLTLTGQTMKLGIHNTSGGDSYASWAPDWLRDMWSWFSGSRWFYEEIGFV